MGGEGGGRRGGAAKTSTYNLHSLFSFVKYVSSTKIRLIKIKIIESTIGHNN
jgi:hypothetical protein